MIDSPPEIVLFAVDLHEHLVQVPAPATGFHAFDPAFADLGSRHRPEPMPPKSNGFMADINAPFMEQIFHIAKGQRKPDVQHHRQTDNLTTCFEIAKWIRFSHVRKVRNRPARLNPVSSDNAIWPAGWKPRARPDISRFQRPPRTRWGHTDGMRKRAIMWSRAWAGLRPIS